MNDLVSVIIPVYNVGEYLQTCIDSVKRQTYKDLQIILVDDGSTDGSGLICDKAAKEDDRIRVIHRTNGGLSAARNSGIEEAHGEYICFIDSDDWVDESFVERLYQLAEKDNADVAACGYYRTGSEEEAADAVKDREWEKTVHYTNIQAVRELIEEKNVKSVVWNKLFKRKLWLHTRFPEGRFHEDEFTTYRVLWEASGVVETDRILYFYRERPSSITGDPGDGVRRKRAFDVAEAKKERYLFFAEREKNLEGIARAQYLDQLKAVIRTGFIKKAEDKKQVIGQYRENALKIWTVRKVSFYKRSALTAWMILIGFI